MAKQYKIIKATCEKLVGVIFECAILNNMNAPKWFSDFVEKQFKPEIAEIKTRLTSVEAEIIEIKTDIADIKVRVSNLEHKMIKVETRLDKVESILKHNNLN